MGIGWDGWQGKDMSRIMEKSAIELGSSKKGYVTSLPIVFILETIQTISAMQQLIILVLKGEKLMNHGQGDSSHKAFLTSKQDRLN